MAQECGFFNAQLAGEEYDRVYLAEQFAAYFASFIGNGVFAASMQELEVIAQVTPAMKIDVLSGQGWINGYWYRNTDSFTLDLSVADGVLSRIDLVVLRWSSSERDMYLTVIEGVPSANPQIPSIRRDADFYDLKLAEVFIGAGIVGVTQSAITDTRMNSQVCGWVHGLIDQIDTTDLYNQFQDFFNRFKTIQLADYTAWTTAQKQAYLTWIAAQRDAYTQFVNQSENNYSNYIENIQNDYDSWVQQKQGDYNVWTAAQKQVYLNYIAETQLAYNNWVTSSEDAYSSWTAKKMDEWMQWFGQFRGFIESLENGELLLRIEAIFNAIFSIATDDDINAIINDTYKEKLEGDSIVDITPESVVDAIISGTYEEEEEDSGDISDSGITEAEITEIVDNAFKAQGGS